MKAEDIYEAMQSVRPEYLEESEMFKGKRKWPRIILIAAVIALSGIGAAAAVWSLRDAARADMGIEQPIQEWKEYEVPAADEPVREGRPRNLDEPDGEKRLDAVTLDSTLCSGDELTAYLRVRGIDPETGALLEDRTCFWYIGGIDRDWGGTVCDSLGVQHVAYDAGSQTALVRLDVSGLRDVERVYFTLTLEQGLETLTVYEPVEIPVTRSGVLSTPVDYAPAQGSYTWEMRAVQAQVYASHVDIDFEFTPFRETEFAEGPFDNKRDESWAFYLYIAEMNERVDEALADATLQYRDGRSEVIAEMQSAFAAEWAFKDFNGKTQEDYHLMSSMAFQHEMSQAVDLSQVESITIGGVTYPLEWKEYKAPVPDGPVRKDGPVEKFPDTVTLESTTRSGDELIALLRVEGVVPELGAFLNDDAYYWTVDGVENYQERSCTVGAHHESYDEDSRTALVQVRISLLRDEERVSFLLGLGHLGELNEVIVAPVEIPITPAGRLRTQLDCSVAQGPYYGKARAVEMQVFDCHVCIDFEITPFNELDSAPPLSGNPDKPREYNYYLHELGDRVDETLADATFQYRDGSSEPFSEGVVWSPRSSVRTTEEWRGLGLLTFCHDLERPIDLSQVVSVTIGGIVYPLA